MYTKMTEMQNEKKLLQDAFWRMLGVVKLALSGSEDV